MGRTARDKRDLPHPKPVERIELNTEHTTRRLVLAGVFLVVGILLLAYSFVKMMSPESEWVNIESSTGGAGNCSSEFTFLYHLSSTGIAAREEQRDASAIYTELCKNAYEIFNAREEIEGVNNLWAINRHPNEELAVDPALYDAFAALEESGSRMLYLGPVHERYTGTFHCTDDAQLADFDPWSSEAVAREYQAYARYANDPQSVRLELLGENRVKLVVSEEYLAFARREEIETLIDFSWMRNGFIVDYLARELMERGCERGALTSYDGFVRCMDRTGEKYSLTVYDRRERGVYAAAEVYYEGPLSAVSLRDHPVNELDEGRFYQTAAGEMRTPYVDLADGFSKASVPDLMCSSKSRSCVEILLAMVPVYIADEFDPAAVDALAEDDIAGIYCADGVIYASGPEPELGQLYQDKTVQYHIAT